jgi:hypothetical protein
MGKSRILKGTIMKLIIDFDAAPLFEVSVEKDGELCPVKVSKSAADALNKLSFAVKDGESWLFWSE